MVKSSLNKPTTRSALKAAAGLDAIDEALAAPVRVKPVRARAAKIIADHKALEGEIQDYTNDRERQVGTLTAALNWEAYEEGKSIPQSESRLAEPKSRRPQTGTKGAFVVVSKDDLPGALRALKGLQRQHETPIVAKDSFTRGTQFQADENGMVRIPVFAIIPANIAKRLEKAGAAIEAAGEGEIIAQSSSVRRTAHLQIKRDHISEAAEGLMAQTGMSSAQAVSYFDTKRGSRAASTIRIDDRRDNRAPTAEM